MPLALPLASGLVLNHASLLRPSSHETGHSPVLMGGKGFGGGEATRDPMPTAYDLNDPKGKQQAIHKAESFSEYLARRAGGTVEAAVCPHAAAAAAPSLAYVPLAAPAPVAAAALSSRHATSRDYLGNAPVQGARSTVSGQHPLMPVGVAHSAGRSGSVDYAAVRRELTLLMDNPSWDDGTLAPIFIRLAWHSSGTYDAATATGGSNGAGMRFETEAADPENAGLHSARAFLEPVKKKFPGISYSDLWILAAYVGIEYTGGPKIPFRPGRVDFVSEVAPTFPYQAGSPATCGSRLPGAEKYITEGVDAEGRPKGWQGLCTHIRDEVFYRMGFGDREIVALLCGGHVYGRCHPTSSGYAGAWVEYPDRWSNEYATDMLEDEWRLVDNSDTWLDAQGSAELRPAAGRQQYVNQCPMHAGAASEDANQMMLVSDMVRQPEP